MENVIQRGGLGLLLSLLAMIVASSALADVFYTQTFKLSAHRFTLDHWRLLPPKGWQPTSGESRLGERLPFDWEDKYRHQFKQEFQPNIFYQDAIALCNYAEATPDRRADAAKLFDELFRRMLEYTDAEGDALWVRNDFDFELHEGDVIPAPWYGGLMNAFAASGLIKAIDCFDDPEYKTALTKLINAFRVLHFCGAKPPTRWFSYVDCNGYLWFDEYPRPDGKATLVLNGDIYAVLALAKYARRMGDRSVVPLINGNLTALKANVAQFRRPGLVNSYDLLPDHDIVDYSPVRTVRQQCQLYGLTGDDVFKTMAQTFLDDITESGFQMPDHVIKYCRH